MAIITTGYDTKQPVTLLKKNATFEISSNAVIKAILMSLDRTIALSSIITINNEAIGTDLMNSLIMIEFSAAQTAEITQYGDAHLEIQVDDGIKLPWSVEVLIRKGNIQ